MRAIVLGIIVAEAPFALLAVITGAEAGWWSVNAGWVILLAYCAWLAQTMTRLTA